MTIIKDIFGETVEIGDTVAILTTLSHSLRTYKGKVVGVTEAGNYKVEYQTKDFSWLDKNGKPVKYGDPKLAGSGYVDVTRKSTLQLNRIIKLGV